MLDKINSLILTGDGSAEDGVCSGFAGPVCVSETLLGIYEASGYLMMCVHAMSGHEAPTRPPHSSSL
jgi:hypothetical protein